MLVQAGVGILYQEDMFFVYCDLTNDLLFLSFLLWKRFLNYLGEVDYLLKLLFNSLELIFTGTSAYLQLFFRILFAANLQPLNG